MDHEFRTYIRHSATVNFVINLLINAALGWWLLREHQALTPFGAAAYGPDLLITGFLLSLIVATIVIETHRRKAARGDMKPVALAAGGWLDAASRRGRLANGTTFGVLGTLISVAPLTLLMATTASLSVPVYAGIKGVWAGLLAAAIVAPATAIGLSLGARQAARA